MGRGPEQHQMQMGVQPSQEHGSPPCIAFLRLGADYGQNESTSELNRGHMHLSTSQILGSQLGEFGVGKLKEEPVDEEKQTQADLGYAENCTYSTEEMQFDIGVLHDFCSYKWDIIVP